MPTDIFDEVEAAPERDIFDEVAEPAPQASPLASAFDQLLNTPEGQRAFLQGTDEEASKLTGPLTRAATKVEDVTGNAVAQVLNLPIAGWNTFERMTGGAHRIEPYGPDTPVIPEWARQDLQTAAEYYSRPGVGPIRAPEATPFSTGISSALGKTVAGLSTPKALPLLPIMGTKTGAELFASQMVAQAPEQIEHTVDVFKDPNSTAADKWEALGDNGVNLAMILATALHMKPGEVKAKFTPDEAAKYADKIKAVTPPAATAEAGFHETEEPGIEFGKPTEAIGPLKAKQEQDEREKEAGKILPKAAEALGAIETKPTETEVSDASGKQEATAVHGDVLAQPGEGQGEVPEQKGVGGVQPQAEGGLPEGAGGEVLLKTISDAPPGKFGELVKQSGFGHTTNWAYDMATKVQSKDIPGLLEQAKKADAEHRAALDRDEVGDQGMKGQFFRETVRMRQAIDDAIAKGAQSDEELAAIANEHGVGAGIEPAMKARQLKEALAKAQPETVNQFDPNKVPIHEVPVSEISVDEAAVPNFKSGADPETGVVPGQRLTGKYERLGTAPVVVWKRANGQKVIITGRHRLDLANRTGEKTIPAQVVEEAQGFTKDMALTFDAEANIRDGQGDTEDYAQYFKHTTGLTQKEAESRGLLSRAKGKAGWDLARSASDDLYSAWQAGKTSEAQALAVTRAAPGNVEAQRIGLKFALDGKPPDFLSNVVKASIAESGGSARALDLFGRDDSTMRAMEEQAKRASDIQKQLREQLGAISGAAKNPDVARKLGVDVNNPEAVQKKVEQLRAELQRWDNWPMHKDLVEQTRAGKKGGESVEKEKGQEKKGVLTSGKEAKVQPAVEAAPVPKPAKKESQPVAPPTSDEKLHATISAAFSKAFADLEAEGWKFNPKWGPLELVLKPEWLDQFMFMGSHPHPTKPGRTLYEYKNGITRRYLRLDDEGQAYGYKGDAKTEAEKYPPLPLDKAIDQSFEGLEQMGETRESKYNEDFIRKKNEALLKAGFSVARNEGKDVLLSVPKKPAEPAKPTGELLPAQEMPFNLAGQKATAPTEKPAESTTGYGGKTAAQQEMFAIQKIVEDKDPEKSANAAQQIAGGDAAKAAQQLRRQLQVVDSDPVTKRNFKKEQRERLKSVIALLDQRGGEPPKFKGPGAAPASEYGPGFEGPTSIKNATVDKELALRGMPPLMEPARRSFGQVWDRAMAAIDRDPDIQDNLIKELDAKPRALTDMEDALLLHRQIDLQNQYGRATRDLAAAHDDGIEREVVEGRLRVAAVSDKLQELYNITKTSGTETARGLNARKMMATQTYELAEMEMSKRAANQGRPLTDDERAEIQRLHEKIAATQKAYDDYRQRTDERIAELEAQRALQDLKTEAETERRSGRKLDLAGEREALTARLKAEAEAGKEPKDMTNFIQKLARNFVKGGITEREPLIEAVHRVLRDIFPDMTRRETMDAISGYGDFKQLSKDEISVQLRGMKGEMQQIAKLEDMAAGQPPQKTGIERRTPTEVERKLIKLVNDAKYKFQIPVSNPGTQLKSALDTLKTALRNRTKELEDRIAAGDYAKRPRRELQLDAEAMRLKAENERAKQEFQRGLTRDRLKQRSSWEKAMDTLVKWRRGFLLSGPVTFAKLTSAAVARMAITPLKEAVGGVYSKLFPKLAEKAPRQGYFNAQAEAKALTEGFTKGMRDAWQVLKTGRSDLDVLYGRNRGFPNEMIDFMGNVHGALKTVTKRNEFARSFEKRTAAATRQGIDASDPFVQMRIAKEAYQDANRSIFLQDNRVVSAYKRALSALDQPNKATGKVPLTSKIAGTAARVLLPIVKIPTNIVAETMEYATGSVTGSARLARAYRRGIETLQPQEADLIMRQLKKGSLGGAAMLLGFLVPTMFGGYYQQGQKRKPKDVKEGGARVAGVNVPNYILHNPTLEALQVGATMRRVADSKLHKKDRDRQGITAGVVAGGLGLAEEVPFVREMMETVKAFNPSERGQFLGELTKSITVPQLLQSAANATDKNKAGNLIQRKPATILQHVETGIPGLRQTVPKKPVKPDYVEYR